MAATRLRMTGPPASVDAGADHQDDKENSMKGNLFRELCEQLGYTPEGVFSVRMDADRVVVVTRASGQLRVTTFGQAEEGLTLVSEGCPVGPRRAMSA
jgi:hypothetical protein